MTVSNVDGQVKGAIGRDVVFQASDVAKEGGATARDDGRNARERVRSSMLPVIDVTVALRTQSDHLMLRIRL